MDPFREFLKWASKGFKSHLPLGYTKIHQKSSRHGMQIEESLKKKEQARFDTNAAEEAERGSVVVQWVGWILQNFAENII